MVTPDIALMQLAALSSLETVDSELVKLTKGSIDM